MLPSIVMFHGWGFSSLCWQDISIQLIQSGYRVHVIDYGYFSNFEINYNMPKKSWIGVAHSFGLVKMLCNTNLQHCIGVINISGFSSFDTKIKVIEKMISSFKQNPVKVLHNFYIKSGLNAEKIISMQYMKNLNYSLLLKDLCCISELNINYHINMPIISIYTENDTIVSKKMAEQTKLLKHGFIFLSKGGHASIVNLVNFYSALIKNFVWQVLLKKYK